MRAKSLPTQEQLRQLFIYEPDTGVLRWRPRSRDQFRTNSSYGAWTANFSGKPAGTRKSDNRLPHKPRSRIEVLLKGQIYFAHRMIWVLMYGSIPDGMTIDHKNCDPWDNRLDNLRLATQSQNGQNRRVLSSSGTGLKGVCRKRDKFQAYISVNGKCRWLGVFNTAKEAHAAYSNEAVKHFGEFARTE